MRRVKINFLNHQHHTLVQNFFRLLLITKEVEQVLVTHPGVAECAVIGLPDNDYGERVVAVVVRQAGMDPEPADIIQFCRGHIASFKAPRHVVFIDELPKTPAGKIQKNLLRKQFAEA